MKGGLCEKCGGIFSPEACGVSAPGVDDQEIDPRGMAREQGRLWSKKAMAAVRAKDWSKALRCFDEAIQADPADCVYWNDRGNVFQELGRHEMAIASYRKCIELNRWYDEAWLGIARSQDRLGQEQEKLHSIQISRFAHFSGWVEFSLGRQGSVGADWKPDVFQDAFVERG